MANSPDTAGVIAPPPLIFAGFLGAGLLLDSAAGFPGIRIPWPLRYLFAALLLWAAAYLLRGALAALRQAGTRVEPWKPSTALVTSGIYRRTRNPIYLGMALAFAAVALAADAIFALVALLPALVVIQLGVIAREEQYLAAKFGAAYRRYASEVRPWI